MFILGPRDQISIPVRVDSVHSVQNQFHGKPELRIEATLRLSPNADEDVRVILLADVEDADCIVVSDEFVAHDVSLKGHCSDENACYKAKVGLSWIWFSSERKGDDRTRLALIMSEVS